jgi:hypothetical protein
MKYIASKSIGVRIGRFLLYISGKLLVCVLAVLMVLFTFRTARNSSQIYFLARDAFSLRTSAILKPIDNSDKDLLSGLFTENYLKKSGLATQTTNSSYTIKSYDERTDVTITVVFSWQNKAKVRVKNVVQDISADISSSALQIKEVDKFIESGVYSFYVVKDANGSWKVDDIVLEKEITPDSVYPIPTVSESVSVDETLEGGEAQTNG